MDRKSRRRGEELESAILDAAWQVLIDSGYVGFTFEAVAARAATSRPVLYRRWSSREQLLLATIQRHWLPLDTPDTGSLRGDAIATLRLAGSQRGRLMEVLALQLAEFFRDSGMTLADLRDRIRVPDAPGAFRVIVDRAVARGELPDVPRSRRVVDLPFDLFRNDLLMTRRAPGRDAIVEIVDDAWIPLLRAGSPRAG